MKQMKIKKRIFLLMLLLGVLCAGCGKTGVSEITEGITDTPEAEEKTGNDGENRKQSEATENTGAPVDTGTPENTVTPTEITEYTGTPEERDDMADAGYTMELIIKSREKSFTDISELELTQDRFMELYYSLIDNECIDTVAPYKSFFPVVKQGDIIKEFYLMYTVSDDDIEKATETMMAAVNKALENITDEMSELEKTLVLHDYVVDTVSYNSKGDAIGTAWGGLVEKKCICTGYANTLLYLLHKAGISAIYTCGGDHAWISVCIDGEWYLIDPTWDDTRNYGKHYFFLRTEEEFETGLAVSHEGGHVRNGSSVSGTEYEAVSADFTDWFVHDITGNILYYEGFWYYSEGTAIAKSRIDGSEKEYIYNGSKDAEILRIENGYAVISENGKEKKISME